MAAEFTWCPLWAASSAGWLPAFSPDGATLIYVVETALTRQDSLFLVPSNGGAPQPFQPDFVLPPVGGGRSSPVWSPDGKYILFDRMRRGDRESRSWWIAPVAGGDAVPVNLPPMSPGAMIRHVAAWQGNCIYYSEGTAIGGMILYRVAVAGRPWRTVGDPERLASPAGMVYGRLVFTSLTLSLNIRSLALKANEGTVSGQLQPVTSDAAGKTGFAVDAGGSKIAWVTYTVPLHNVEIHIRDLAGGREDIIA